MSFDLLSVPTGQLNVFIQTYSCLLFISPINLLSLPFCPFECYHFTEHGLLTEFPEKFPSAVEKVMQSGSALFIAGECEVNA